MEPSTRYDIMECGQEKLLNNGQDLLKGEQYKMMYPFRWARSFVRYILNFLQYLVSFTTSDWIIQYLTSWY